tara:strand:+ start:3575 stop:3811 length:237 start_codon:yes stop_codon:yes gene_type:complete
MTKSPSDIVERDDILKDREYLLIGTSTWIDVRTLTVNVQRVDGAVKIDIWPRELLRGYEPIASVEVPFSQGTSEVIDD